MKQFDQDVAKQIAFKEAEKRTPDRMSNLLMLLLCVAISVVMLMICVAMVLTDKPWLQAPGLIGIFLTIFCFWKVLDSPAMYQTTERIIGRDLDGDGYIGPPPQTHIEFKASEKTTWMAHLPARPELIQEWAEAAVDGRSLGYRKWNSRFALLPDGSDGPARYAQFRDALVRSKLAIEGGKSGIRLTERGFQYFTEHAHQRPQGRPLLDG